MNQKSRQGPFYNRLLPTQVLKDKGVGVDQYDEENRNVDSDDDQSSIKDDSS